MVTTSLAGLVIIGLVNHYGAHATAAYGAVNQVLNYINFQPPFQLRPHFFAAQAIGAGKPDLLAKVTRTAFGNECHIYWQFDHFGLLIFQIFNGAVYYRSQRD